MVGLYGVPMWLLVLVAALVMVGVWETWDYRAVKRVDGLPVWFCALLALVALVGMWVLLNAQFGGQAIGIHL